MTALEVLQAKLPALGHRNWVLVADAAYPEQCAPGIETVVTDEGLVETLRAVLQLVETSPHVRAVALLDLELNVLEETDLPGVEQIRDEIMSSLAFLNVEVQLHEEILNQMAAAATTYKVFVIKTPCTIPYTSVFLRLECGYWTSDQEARLREQLEKCQTQ